MAQVKFYSVAALPISPSGNGLYFVNGGELYKGSQRFGLGRVTSAATADALAALTSAARGDINVGYQGAKVYDGSTWQPLGGDIDSLQTSWRADISAWVAGLKVGGANSFITSITQAEDGKVTASAAAFPTLNLNETTQDNTSNDFTVSVTTQSGAVTGVAIAAPSLSEVVPKIIGAGAASSAAGGITVSVATTSGKVTGVEVEIGTITASAAEFTNLTVTSTATFNVTNVSASTLTVGGQTVAEIAQGVLTASTTTTVRASTSADNTHLPTEKAVRDAIDAKFSGLDTAMHFVGAGTALPASAQAGDIYVFTADATDGSGYKSGQEVIYKGDNGTYSASNWEVIGDQNTYAPNAYTSTASVYNNATNVAGALDAAGAQIDILTASASTFASDKAKVGASTSALKGLSVQMTLHSNAQPSIALDLSGVVTASTNMAQDALVTASAVKAYVDAMTTAAVWSAATSSSANGVIVSVTVDEYAANKLVVELSIDAVSTSGAITEDSDKLVTASAVAIYVGGYIGTLDATVSSSAKGIEFSVVESDGRLTTASITVTAASQMAFDANGSADELATTAAIRNFYDNNLVWLDAFGSAIS